jgi:lipopolysaccharide export system protein LptA
MARPGRTSLRLLRALALVVFLVSLTWVLVLLFANPGDIPTSAGRDEAPIEGQDLRGRNSAAAVVATGFRKTFEQEGRVLFEIAGERLLADREDNVFLEGVEISFSRPDGLYRIESRNAEYNQVRGEARLEGEVTVNSPDGMKLFTEWLDLSQNGNLLQTSRGSRFEIGDDLEGEAAEFRMDFTEEVILLSGGVVVGSRPGIRPAMRLRADDVSFRQASRLARAQGNVRLRREGDDLRCERLSLYLDETEDIVRYVRALWKVRGVISNASLNTLDAAARGAPAAWDTSDGADGNDDENENAPPGQGAARFRGASLAVAINRRSEIESLDLEGVRKLPAVFAADDGQGHTRRVSASGVRVSFRDQRPQSVDALGDVELTEFANVAPDVPIRLATAMSLHAELDGSGQLAKAELRDQVVLHEGGLSATAARAEMLLVQDRVELVGEPSVVVTSEQGELVAPRVTYNQGTGLVHARGGVQSLLAAGSEGAAGGPLGAEGEPVRVESGEALLRRGSSEFLFREDVRAWAGSSVLFADQLRGSADGTELSASGAVRSLLKSVSSLPTAGKSPQEGADPAGGKNAAKGLVEVTAEILTYSRQIGNLVYEGGVVAQQNGRKILCQKLEVDLSDEQRAEQMLCSGSAEIQDPISQRIIRGDRAEYDLSTAEVILFGEPLTLEDPAVGKVSGYRLWYSMESGLFKMGEAGGTTPTDS